MTVRWNISDRADAAHGLFKSPAASSTSRLTNGKPMDSGAVMRLSSNIAHLCYESCRHLVASPGLGPTAGTYQNAVGLYGPVREIGFYNDAVDALVISGSSGLPWDPRVCESFLAFVAADRQSDAGPPTLRSIRFSIDYTGDATNSSTSIGFAITTHNDPARLRDGDYLAFHGSGALSTGNQIYTQTLSCQLPITPRHHEAHPGRPASYTSGDTMGFPLPVYLWFGWKFVGTGTGNQINGMSAWESRIDPA